MHQRTDDTPQWAAQMGRIGSDNHMTAGTPDVRSTERVPKKSEIKQGDVNDVCVCALISA
jgi:hypothetical protein